MQPESEQTLHISQSMMTTSNDNDDEKHDLFLVQIYHIIIATSFHDPQANQII